MTISDTATQPPQWLGVPAKASFDAQPEVLKNLRRMALQSFTAQGLPTTRHEDWRHTNLEPLTKTDFQPRSADNQLTESDLASYALADELRVVCVDGQYRPELSSITDFPEGLTVESFADGLSRPLPEGGDQAGAWAFDTGRPLEALNMAWLTGGVQLNLSQGLAVEAPLHIYIVSTAADHPTVTYPRVEFSAGENSQISVIEHHIGLGEQARLTPAASRYSTAPGAVVEVLKLQSEGAAASHLGVVQGRQAAGSSLRLIGISTGGALIRNEVTAELHGAGATVEMSGLYLVRGREHVDNHTRIDHVAPNTSSVEIYKGILADSGQGIFTGRIVVHPDAQHTDARQTNRNLMLSDQALVHTDPQLEIFADDVKCSHGSTVGQVDDEALFYFRTRGIAEGDARRLLVHGFSGEVLQRIGHRDLRKLANQQVNRWLEGLPA